jgi:hypothetical protein
LAVLEGPWPERGPIFGQGPTYKSPSEIPIIVLKFFEMSDSIVNLHTRLAALRALFTEDHAKFIQSKKVQDKCPGLTVDAYLEEVAAQVDWSDRFVIDMRHYPEGEKGDILLRSQISFAAKEYSHIDFCGAVVRSARGDLVEDLVPFGRIHAAVALLFTDPTAQRFLHLVGPKLNTFPNPLLMCQVGEDKAFRFTGGGYTIPGQPQSEIDFVVRPIDLERGVPAVSVCIMCGYLSNFNLMPPGLTAAAIGCSPELCPDGFWDSLMTSAEQSIHYYKSFAYGEFACFRKPFADTTQEQRDALCAAVGPTDIMSDDVERLGMAVVRMISKSSDPSAAKSLGRVLPLQSRYFDLATGTRMETMMPLTLDDLERLGLMPLINAAGIVARMSGPAADVETRNLLQRLAIGAKQFHAFAEMEGAIHGPVKSEAGASLFGGKDPDVEWGSVAGCPRNVTQVTDFQSAKKLPGGHLGRGVSLVYGAMRGDRDTMAFLGLSAPLVPDNSLETAGLIIDGIWRRIRADAARAV